jgi:hypothetical protein
LLASIRGIFLIFQVLLHRTILSTLLASVFVVTAPVIVMAQRYEIHPYAGGFYPAKWADTTSLKSDGLYGARGGIYLTQTLELEGNWSYINHFTFEDRDVGTRAMLWDVNSSYSFLGLTFSRLEPFATFGIGAVKINTRGPQNQRILFLDPTFRNPDSTMSPAVLTNGQSFLALNYGGGVKAFRLWGPIGVRTDLHVRTMPNFFDRANHWFEVTAGVNIAWGEE